ncbi:NYN domain-containing protein [Acidithiobacillus ferriphilus]|jgi:uncharacterized LabA/DUF88 family protein|uniref:NYN domain-containing protein n=1 Tax=Acidithiobacillus ferriphilus TaxID=1689834 RepID=UPI001C0761E7|nr:NYN domain-containing protein [Acidithiobacillus ferriphilus]MBU2828738.1 NYN domain-containing protein [Acidithiobacillus ferriphilus]MBU2845165.1 NYN domain-containing protein [Acidithiobacillus ferriphilus]MEB8476037.1 NYN domain-containing protein [Acidithiobacillus ferriphilus]
MSIPKTFVFADGENLVMRYQAMVEAGHKPKNDVIHIPDVFVWHPGITTWSCMDIQRATYYTSAVGDQPKIKLLRSQIAATTFDFTHEYGDVPEATGQLVPRIFHKQAKSRKTRNVDINIIIDMMRAAHLNSAEVLLLLSGDGDYLPLVEECMRLGKPAWVCSFSSGLNGDLPTSVDLYVSLDEIFFQKPKKT